MALLILLRHGQSAWNEQNLFTGWVDIPLSAKGIQESIEAGKKIAHLPVEVIYTSSLIRAHMTLSLAMLSHASQKIPIFLHSGQGRLEDWGAIYSEKSKEQTIAVHTAWELNERMYGRLQGCNKDEMRQQFGAEQVQLWRRSFDIAPPDGESLAMTAARAVPYFQTNIFPSLQAGSSCLVVAHGNSLRSIVMHLEKLSKEEVLKLELATGDPLVYRYERETFERIHLPR